MELGDVTGGFHTHPVKQFYLSSSYSQDSTPQVQGTHTRDYIPEFLHVTVHLPVVPYCLHREDDLRLDL